MVDLSLLLYAVRYASPLRLFHFLSRFFLFFRLSLAGFCFRASAENINRVAAIRCSFGAVRLGDRLLCFGTTVMASDWSRLFDSNTTSNGNWWRCSDSSGA